MNILIAYHPGHPEPIEELVHTEAWFIHTRGIDIETITSCSENNSITVYPSKKPAQVIKQDESIYLISEENLKLFTEGGGLFKKRSTILYQNTN